MTMKPTAQDVRDLEDALLVYLTAVDEMKSVDALLAAFTEDAVVDLSGLDLPVLEGPDAIRGFFTQVFESMSHHMHTLSNFRVLEFSETEARTHCYICGMGRSHAGVDIQVWVYYDLKMRRTTDGWRIAHFYEAPKLPMPDSVGQVHKD